MRDRLMSMSTWALLPFAWVTWFAVSLVVNLLSSDSVLQAIVLAAVVGAALAVATVVPLKLRGRFERRAVGEVPEVDRRAAVRAARTGPVPTDPDVRAAALRLAEQDLRRLRRSAPLLAISGGLYLTGEIALAILNSSWHLLFAALLIPLGISFFQASKRLRARIELLSEPQGPVLRT